MFGNPAEWIFDAIGKALKKFSGEDLEVILVAYGAVGEDTKQFIKEMLDEKVCLAGEGLSDVI